MKKLMALCVLLALTGMLSVGNTLATSETQESTNPLTTFFQKVQDLLAEFGSNPTESDSLEIDTLFQIRDTNGCVIESNRSDLYPVDTNHLSITEQAQINGHNCLFWPRTSGATDKIISVKNTANETVYFRTALLIKCSDTIWQNMKLNRNTADYIWEDKHISIDGNSYPMLIATYKSSLQGGQISPPMILQIAVDSAVVGALDTFSFETQTFAIQAAAFGSRSAETALNSAIPNENIASAFGGKLEN